MQKGRHVWSIWVGFVCRQLLAIRFERHVRQALLWHDLPRVRQQRRRLCLVFEYQDVC